MIKVHLRDLNGPLVAAWSEAFGGVEEVEVTQGGIFDVTADAIVSPANSFGFMDGGIDGLYTRQFGKGLQEALQALLAKEYGGQLPVGDAVIVPTGDQHVPWCISAPTMWVPEPVAHTVNAYLAFRAALRVVERWNERWGWAEGIRTVLCPGLATATGRMPVERCAAQMRAAWDDMVNEPTYTSWDDVRTLYRQLLS